MQTFLVNRWFSLVIQLPLFFLLVTLPSFRVTEKAYLINYLGPEVTHILPFVRISHDTRMPEECSPHLFRSPLPTLLCTMEGNHVTLVANQLSTTGNGHFKVKGNYIMWCLCLGDIWKYLEFCIEKSKGKTYKSILILLNL